MTSFSESQLRSDTALFKSSAALLTILQMCIDLSCTTMDLEEISSIEPDTELNTLFSMMLSRRDTPASSTARARPQGHQDGDKIELPPPARFARRKQASEPICQKPFPSSTRNLKCIIPPLERLNIDSTS